MRWIAGIRGASRTARPLGFLSLLTLGFLLAWTVAGCGGGGNASSALSTRTGAISRDASTADAATTTESRPPVTLTRTQTQTIQTQTIQTPTVATQTVQQTVIAPPRTTPSTVATTETSSSGTPAWVWVLIAAGAVAGIVLLVWLIRGRGSGRTADERDARASAAVESWVAQGWAIESQIEGSTIMRRDGERIMVSVNEHGHVTSMPLSEREPPGRPGAGPPPDDQWRGG